MVVVAFLGALAIGLCLGLLGSGGSILTVPVLVYLLNEPDKVAIAESLAIVGGISAVAAIPHAIYRRVDFRSVILFGIAGMVGAQLGALASLWLTGPMQLGIFAFIMLLASYKMLSGSDLIIREDTSDTPAIPIILNGFLVGCLTGLIGVGGGFLIVPALVLLGHLSMHIAVGTSLVIIAMNCLSGFLRHLKETSVTSEEINWTIILLFATVGIVGSLIGGYVGSRLPQDKLKKVFGIFVLLMGIYILVSQLYVK